MRNFPGTEPRPESLPGNVQKTVESFEPGSGVIHGDVYFVSVLLVIYIVK